MDLKTFYLEIYDKHIQRPGADNLRQWIVDSDFFTAPASTKFHLSCERGLVAHSIHVFDRLAILAGQENMGHSMESVAICALLHDLCKVNYYGIENRNKKDDQGVWHSVPVYVVKDQFPFGHGEKSFYLISRCMQLTPEEAIAIRWHMGQFDDAAKGGSYALNDAYNNYPLAVMLHIADMQATYFDDNTLDPRPMF